MRYHPISLMILAFLFSITGNGQTTYQGFVHSVNGPLLMTDMGFTLTHEHIMSNFGAPASYDPAYDKEKLFHQVIPYLKYIKVIGVNTIFDCTAAYFGRDAKLLKELADSTGLNIITNTGIYGAAKDRYIPEYARKESIEEISERWIKEFDKGIDDTGIKPGFIKMAFDNGEPSDIDLKLFRAGALTHLETGLTMAVHTGDNPEAVIAQQAILEEYEIDPKAWIWVHANKADSIELLVEIAQKGSWISFDGIRDEETRIKQHLQLLKVFRDEKLLERVLLSHDGNSFPRGGPIRRYEALKRKFIMKMKREGFSEKEIKQLTIENPKKAFAIRVRKRKGGKS